MNGNRYRVSSIFKVGLKTEIGNYRPISVLSTVSKVFEKIICKQISKYFDDNNYLKNINQDLGKVVPSQQHC